MHRFAVSAAVPWSTVGPGWFLVSVRATTTALVLVDPTGRHYPVYTAPSSHWHVVAWSGDGHRVLLQTDRRDFPGTTEIVDLESGLTWRPSLPTGTGVLGFTRPEGLGLLTAAVSEHEENSYTHYRIERRSLYGGDAVVISRNLVPDTYTQHVVYTVDGAHVVVGSGKRLVLVANATGAVGRTLGPTGKCTSPIRMWDATHVLAACSSSLALVPLDGSKVVPIVRTNSKHGPDYKDVDVFRTADGELYTDSLGACGSEFVGHVDGNGRVSQTQVPHATENTVPLDVRADRVAVEAELGCEGPEHVPSLFWWDPASGAEQVIWAPQHGDRGADFLPFQSGYVAPAQAWLP